MPVMMGPAATVNVKPEVSALTQTTSDTEWMTVDGIAVDPKDLPSSERKYLIAQTTGSNEEESLPSRVHVTA